MIISDGYSRYCVCLLLLGEAGDGKENIEIKG